VEAGAVTAILDLGAVPLPFTARSVFGRDCPVELEIGSGKGRFLVERAAACPEAGVIGVERARKYLEMSARRAERRGLENVRLVHSSAEDVLFRCVADGSLRAAFVFFPDPWPKKRHHKRRFVRPENAARLAEVLEPGGLLLVKTDHPAYAEVIAEVFAAESRLVREDEGPAFAELPATSFEVKYERESRVFHRFAWRRRRRPAGPAGEEE